MAKPWARVRTPIVQLLAVSEDQTRNAWTPLLEMLRQGPVMDEYDGLEPMDSQVNLPSGRIEFRTANATSAEGNKPVFAILDQALALDTPIPTPSGWTTMGELRTGDVVYGSNGPVRVSEAKPVSTEHDCYRVHFSDGTSVVASAGHLWASRRVGWPKEYDRVRTTEEMLDGYRYSIPAAPIQDRPDVALPVPPQDWVAITAIEKVERVPVRCIAVDSDDHLFAFGESGLLTHNTESWYPSNGGVKLAAAVRRNAGKVGGSTIEAPNAFEPGAGSVAEASAQYAAEIEAGNAKDTGLLYDHREWPETTDLEDAASIIEGLALAYGDSAALPHCVVHDPPCTPKHWPAGWVDLERIQQEIWDPATLVSDAARFYGNKAHADADALFSDYQWSAALAPEEVAPVTPVDPVVLGFDGSRHRKKGVTDATALVAMRVSDGLAWPVGVWEQPDTAAGRDWEPPEMEIEQTLAEFMDSHHVVGFYADPSLWESNVAGWEARWGDGLKIGNKMHPIQWRTSQQRRTAEAVELLQNGVLDGQIMHTGSAVLTRHVLNARLRQKSFGKLMYKEFPDSPRKIDAAYALMLANLARIDAIAHGDLEKKTRNWYVPRRVR